MKTERAQTQELTKSKTEKCAGFKEGKHDYDGVRSHPFMTSTRSGRESGSGWRMWTGEVLSPIYGRPHRQLKLESTDVILSSSHAKKFLYFFTRISSLD